MKKTPAPTKQPAPLAKKFDPPAKNIVASAKKMAAPPK